MSIKFFRSFAQIAFLVGILYLNGDATCWGCTCGSGSDHEESPAVAFSERSVPLATDESVVQRWHDFSVEGTLDVVTRDVQFARERASEYSFVIGLQVPQAADAASPGILTDADHHIRLFYDQQTQPVRIGLASDDALAADIASVLTPDPTTHWQALTPTDENWYDFIPTEGLTASGISGYFFYVLDFLGEDACNGCEIKMTVCSNYAPSFSERLLARTYGIDINTTAGGLTCIDPRSTFMTLMGPGGTLLDGPVIASFGYWGGAVLYSTQTSEITIPILLQHTSVAAETFDLPPIDSVQGWDYSWQDLEGNPITNIEVPAMRQEIWTAEPNLQIYGQNLPTCTNLSDTIYFTATHTLTPTLQAVSSTFVPLQPDPNTCTIVDVGVSQAASAEEIQAGDWITFTVAITNHETIPLNVVVTGTLSTAAAISDADLMPECHLDGSIIACEGLLLQAQASDTFEIVLRASDVFGGSFEHQVRIDPVDAVDARYYDNLSRPIEIAVIAPTPTVTPTPTATPDPDLSLFLPMLLRR